MENELFESCKTRTVTVKKPFKLKTVKVDGKKRLEEERIEYAEEQVVVPANVTAQIFYLKNRRPRPRTPICRPSQTCCSIRYPTATSRTLKNEHSRTFF